MRVFVCLAAGVVLLALAGTAPTHAEEPSGPAYDREPRWDARVRGPLPKWNVEEGPPAPLPDRIIPPYAIDLAALRAAPTAGLVTSPAEHTPMDGIMLRYGVDDWPEFVTDLVAALTGDPAHDERAWVVVSGTSERRDAETDFLAAGADLTKVTFLMMPTDSIWLRDYGPHFIWQDGALAVADSHYYRVRKLDNFLPTLLADDYWNLPSYDMGLYYSGGNFLPSGNRQAFTTSLVEFENPEMDSAFIAELFGTYQGIDTLHVFQQLPWSVDQTGHIDMWFYPVDDDTVVIAEFIPGSDATAIAITDGAATYMEGLGYEVFRVPALNAFHPWYSGTHYSYANGYRVNDRIFIPSYGDGDSTHLARDAQALAVWQQAAPGLEIVQIPSYDVIWAAGGPHCIIKQVPRYTSAAPSAVVLSPEGGELLVSGSLHEIRWAATDDVGIDSVDLYYSTDGGATFPGVIALGEPHDGSFDWTVPLEDTATAIVKVVAHDADANSDEALSGAPFSIRDLPRQLYDFSTGAGVDRWAWGDEWPIMSSIETVRYPVTVVNELSSQDYDRIAVSDATGGDNDANRYRSNRPENEWKSTHLFEFTIGEDPAAIVDIELRWEGYAEDCTQMELYVWDDVEGRWCDGRGQCGENRFVDNFAGNRDEELVGHLRQDFQRYVDASGLLTMMLYAERGNGKSFHDYVSVHVTHDPCLVAADADGDGVGEICDNCPGLANAGQLDADLDGHGDACDNCPAAANADQLDDDADERGNVCDCAPADGGAFEIPHEIVNVVWPSKTEIAWDSDAPNSGSGVDYDLVRAGLGELPVGSGGSATCVAAGWAATSFDGTATPAAGSGFYYLVRGGNACGAGTYGAETLGDPRLITVCD